MISYYYYYFPEVEWTTVKTSHQKNSKNSKNIPPNTCQCLVGWQKGWLCRCDYTLERVCYQVILIIFHKKNWSELSAFFNWPVKQASLHQDMNLWASFFVKISHFENDVAESQKCIYLAQITLLNMSKSARVYNRPLSSLHSTVCDNRKIINLENEVAELVEMHWFKCRLSLQIYQNLPEFTICPWVPSTRILTGYNSILRQGHHVSLITSTEVP